MADQLFLSLWFPNFRGDSLPATLLCVLRQFPFSPAKPGVRAAASYPLDWNQATVYQRTWEADEIPDQPAELLDSQLQHAIGEATEALHDDFAYEFEVYWDVWMPGEEEGKWERKPSLVRVAALGAQFDDGAAEQSGHLRLDLGLDTPFLHSELALDSASLDHVQQNIAALLEFTARLERNCNVASRLLWSDDDSTLAQKLLERLQKLN